MISKRHRFHGLGSLNFAYRRGKTVRFGGLLLRYAPNPRQQTWRAAVVVSRKVAKSAVTRNRIRRRVYEQLRLTVPEELPPHDLVITVFDASLADMPAAKLQSRVSRLLKTAKL